MAWNSLIGCFLSENIYLGWNVPSKLIQRTIGNFVHLVNVQIFEAGEMQGSQTPEIKLLQWPITLCDSVNIKSILRIAVMCLYPKNAEAWWQCWT